MAANEGTPPIPQGLMDRLTKPNTPIPDSLKDVPISTLRRFNSAMDKLNNSPVIKVRGGEVKVRGKFTVDDAKDRLAFTSHKEGQEKSNLVDYVMSKPVIETMLQEAFRTGVVTEGDLYAIGIHADRLKVGDGEKIELKLPEKFKRMDKAEAVGLVVSKLAEISGDNPHRATVFLDYLQTKVLTGLRPEHSADFTNEDLLNALVVGGQEQAVKAFLESAYRPYDRSPEGRKAVDLKVAAEITGISEGKLRKLVGEMPAFKEVFKPEPDQQGKPEKTLALEHSVAVDFESGRAMLNIFVPAEYRTAMLELQMRIDKSEDPVETQNLIHQLNVMHEAAYAGILNAYSVEGYQDGQEQFNRLGTMGLASDERSPQTDALKIAKFVEGRLDRKNGIRNQTLMRANRQGFVDMIVHNMGVSVNEAANIVEHLDLTPSRLSDLADALELKNESENRFVIEDMARNMKWDETWEVLEKTFRKNAKGMNEDQIEVVKNAFFEMWKTEDALLNVKGAFKDVEDPNSLKISQAAEWGLKGLDAFFRYEEPGKAKYENMKEFLELIHDQVDEADRQGAVLQQRSAQELREEAAARTALQAEAEATAQAQELENQRLINLGRRKEVEDLTAQVERERAEAERLAFVDKVDGTVDYSQLSNEELQRAAQANLLDSKRLRAEMDNQLGLSENSRFKKVRRIVGARRLNEEKKARLKVLEEAAAIQAGLPPRQQDEEQRKQANVPAPQPNLVDEPSASDVEEETAEEEAQEPPTQI